jgi:hypothetical protein
MTPEEDPDHPNNSDAYHTGYQCVEGCGRPAGTAWSPLWCQPCNAERLSSVRNSLKDIADHQQNAAQGGGEK